MRRDSVRTEFMSTVIDATKDERQPAKRGP
jgi:hypothetical protein